MQLRSIVTVAIVASCLALQPQTGRSCTRCIYLGPNDTVLVARSMDWVEDPSTEIYCFPRGMSRNGASGPNTLSWTSKYGSLVCSFYKVATVDGINEKGLVANTLYLVESDYGRPVAGKSTMSIATWTQYVLDTYATVKEAVASLEKEPFTIIAPTLPNGVPGVGHMAISDPSGDSAILEYVKGKLVIHHDRKYQVMTNSPTFDQQLALDAYWKGIGGLTMLPGTNRASDRFVRTSFYLGTLPQTDDSRLAVAQVFSVIRNASVPLGLKTAAPNVGSTIWRTLYNHRAKTMYFDSATSPTVFWIPLADLDFTAGAPVKKLALIGGETYNGNAAKHLAPVEPFAFLPAKAE
jgi:penicillin V acylase-like amidase (Ntn superfamily)